jgi:periplasmic protein TonB
MNWIIPMLIILLTASQGASAQAYKNEKLVWLDAAGKRTREKEAAALEQVIRLGDTLWEINLYRINGPRFRSLQSSDPDGNMLNGQYISYNGIGQIDTVGSYYKDQRTGIWNIYTPKGRLAARQSYKNGQLLGSKDSIQIKQENDSLSELFKTGDGKTIVRIEIESSFPDGAAGWLRYLQKNMRYPDKAVKNLIQGQVVIGFIVDAEGHVERNSVWVNRSVEYSLDQEALRIIFSSPDWTPAVQNGRKVKSYKKQPIIFALRA